MRIIRHLRDSTRDVLSVLNIRRSAVAAVVATVVLRISISSLIVVSRHNLEVSFN